MNSGENEGRARLDTDQLLASVVAWATDTDDIRAVVLTGSAAAGPAAMDVLSDLDVELYVDDPARLLDDGSWYHRFGEVLVVEELDNPGWNPTRLVHYAGGKIDFMIGSSQVLGQTAYDRPFAVLVDKDGLAAGLERAAVPDRRPSSADLDRCNQWFYAAALMCAKAIARRDPWQAKVRDWDAKSQLLQMIEWDHGARHGWGSAAWEDGKRLDRWADADIRSQLDACWAGFAIPDAERALMATLDLFDALSARTAGALGFGWFDPGPVRQEIGRILAISQPAG